MNANANRHQSHRTPTESVAIVGAGPTGALLAIELVRRGVDVRVFDKLPAPPCESRAIGIQARTLEMMHQLGVAHEFLESGHRVDGVAFHTGRRRPVRVSFGGLETPYPFLLTLSQEATQQILDRELLRLGVVVERGVEVKKLDADPDGVALGLIGPAGTGTQTVADWVVGCDGAHSVVRRGLGVPFNGHDYAMDFLMAEVRVEGPLERGRFHVFASTPAPLPMFPLPGGRWRVFVPQVAGRLEREPPTFEEIGQLVAERGPHGMSVADPSLLAAFRTYRRSVPRMRHGRVLVAGDAAHIHSPAGGQGMNTGLQDAFNLGWKLALVSRGRAPASLLDTYEAERLPVAAGVLEFTHQLMTTFAMPSPRRRWVRDRLLPAAGALPAVRRRYTERISQLAYTYRGGPLADEPRDDKAGTLRAGDRLPPVGSLVRDGRAVSTLDLVGRPGHTLLILSADAADSAGELRTRLACWGEEMSMVEISQCGGRDVVADPDLGLHARYGARDGGLVLVRPDGHVACTARLSHPEVVERYLHRLLGRGPR